MSLHLVEATITGAGRAPVAGLPAGYVPGIMRHEASLLDAIGATSPFEIWLQAGGYSTTAAPPVTERNAAGGALWTAANNALTRESSPAVMGGRKRLVTSGQAAEGMRGTLSSAPGGWSGYTIILPDVEFNAIGQNQCLFSVGLTASVRMTFFLSVSGNLSLNHGTGGNTIAQPAGNSAVAGQRYSVMATWRASDMGIALYRNSATPVATGTIAQSPGASAAAGLFGSADNNVSSNLKASQAILLRSAITNPAQIAAVMAACAAIRSFTV